MFANSDSAPFYTDVPTRFNHGISYVDFNQVGARLSLTPELRKQNTHIKVSSA